MMNDRAWWVMSGDELRSMLRRAANGEDPDVIYTEAHASAEREQVPLTCRAERWNAHPVYEGPHGPHQFHYGPDDRYLGSCAGWPKPRWALP